MDKAVLIQLMINALTLAFFFVYIEPFLNSKMGFFTAVIFFASMNVIGYGLSRFLVNSTRSSLVLVVAGGFGIVLLFTGLLNPSI